MSCPYFWPTREMTKEEWTKKPRMPLGEAHVGTCKASAGNDYTPTVEELKSLCNPGYPMSCPRFPKGSPVQSARFAVIRDDNVGPIGVAYVLEHEHAPYEHGTLEYDTKQGAFLPPHKNPTIDAQATAYVKVYLREKSEAPARTDA